MRIISGQWGGRNLPGKPSEHLRPTSDKVKEALFDQLEARYVQNWADLDVLDLFAGTGALGIEALSRGAKSATFVDHHLSTIKQIGNTLNQFEAQSRGEVLCKGVMEAIRSLHKKERKFDFIFLDPPYREDWVSATLICLHDFPLLKKKGIVIAEHDKRENLSTVEASWKLETGRRYGDTMLSILSPL